MATALDTEAPPSTTARTKPTLTPPTSEEWNKAEGDVESELSELEDLDDDDIGDIEPDHYYEGGKIPVFKPNLNQFRSFKKFIEKVNKYGMKSGIVKVIPPKEWSASLPALDQAVKSIKVKNPITQEFSGSYGTYTQANVEKQRSYNLPQWKALTEETQHQPPARRGEARKKQEKPTRAAAASKPKPAAKPAVRSGPKAPAATQSSETPPKKKGPGRPRKHPLPQQTLAVQERQDGSQSIAQTPELPTPTSPNPDGSSPKTSKAPKPKQTRAKAVPRSRVPQAKSVTERRKYNQQEVAEDIDESAFEDFDYRFDGNEEFTAERCRELETHYWKSLTFAPPMYGADMPGSLFDDTTENWNVAKLENLLDVLGQKVPGVNTAYLYLGMWKATFAWHLEDVDLYSINYIHFGAPKQWYSISQEDARRFESAMKDVWPNDSKNCGQFLRHKTYLISPSLLKSKYNLTVNKLVHNEGEFVITFPYGYHSGYNLGYNCAESVNFATEEWLEYGRIAKKCDCEADSVWIDVYEIERKLRGEPTPEYYEETDEDEEDDDGAADLPTPPQSVVGKTKAVTGKRKRQSAMEKAPRKVQRIKIRLKSNIYEPCVLCPNDMPMHSLLRTDTGKQAHEICAHYIPETSVKNDNGNGKIVAGVPTIDKARLDLKCSFCRSKKGACFQCTETKCIRAFHATCAAAAGVRVECGPTPWFDADGTEYEVEGFDFRCRFHRPRRPKSATSDSVESNLVVQKFARGLQAKMVIQMQFLQGEFFGGIVVENRLNERTVVVDVLPEGDRVEVEWKYILAQDPAESKLVKPSPNAKPLPDHLDPHHLETSNPEFGPPKPGDPFAAPDGLQKWAEYNFEPIPRNADQQKIDFSKDNKLWHYLPGFSTETKDKYTEDPARKRHNPMSTLTEPGKVAVATFPAAPRRSAPGTYNNAQKYRGPNGPTTYPKPSPSSSGNQAHRPYDYKPKAAPYPSNPYSNLPQQPNNAFARPPQPPVSVGRNIKVTTATNPTPRQLAPNPTSPIAQRPPLSSGPSQPGQTRRPSNPMTPTTLQRPAFSPPTGFPRPAPIAPMTAPTAPMIASPANAGSSTQQAFSPSSETEQQLQLHESLYKTHIFKFPYLRNAFQRRPRAHVSPYPSNGEFTVRYTPNVRFEQTSGPNSMLSAENRSLQPTSQSVAPHTSRATGPSPPMTNGNLQYILNPESSNASSGLGEASKAAAPSLEPDANRSNPIVSSDAKNTNVDHLFAQVINPSPPVDGEKPSENGNEAHRIPNGAEETTVNGKAT